MAGNESGRLTITVRRSRLIEMLEYMRVNFDEDRTVFALRRFEIDPWPDETREAWELSAYLYNDEHENPFISMASIPVIRLVEVEGEAVDDDLPLLSGTLGRLYTGTGYGRTAPDAVLVDITLATRPGAEDGDSLRVVEFGAAGGIG